MTLPPTESDAERFLTKCMATLVQNEVEPHLVVQLATRLRQRVFLEMIRAADPLAQDPTATVIDLQKEAAYRALAKELASKTQVTSPPSPFNGSVDP